MRGCLALVTDLLLALGVAAAAPTDGSARRDGDAATYDPLAFTQPVMPDLPRGRTTTAQLERVLEHLVDTYTYAARTGFESPLLEVVRSPGLAAVEEDVAMLTADDRHAVMEPVTLSVLARTEAARYGRGAWCAAFRIEVRRGPAVLADDAGVEVGEARARTTAADVSVCSHQAWAYVHDAAPHVSTV